ncbi:MAG: tRNA glutamyl-Q(34) synthetase GluQRS [Granulosicoccaceae bacterium]
MNTSGQYLGRFAPSPSGELHFGSLVAAMASYCDAKHNHGQWLVRIDNIDPPREVSGATNSIIESLKAFGLNWDNDILMQADRSDAYRSALNTLSAANLLYCCSCIRRDLKAFQHYPGRCVPASLPSAQNDVMNRLNEGAALTSIRMRIQGTVRFIDLCHGPIETDFNQTPDDPILVRKDGLFSYALACAIDDADGITHVVRGSDLLGTTSHQIAIMHGLGMTVPQYAHIPLATGLDGHKLSKQTHAAALDPQNAIALLGESWVHLGQDRFTFSTTGEFWNAAVSRWQLSKVNSAIGS